MGRELRRVPLDFDWPIDKVWDGYLTPAEIVPPECNDCTSGYSRQAQAMFDSFYEHQVGPTCWGDKIGQAEVDNLVENERLGVWEGGEWTHPPRLADDINIDQHRGGLSGHDALNVHLLVKFRCEVLGIPNVCPTCDGRTFICTQEEYDRWENYEGPQPPTGDGYQLWETTSEGSPQTPVFATLDELCVYAAEHCTTFGSSRTSAAEWKRMLDDGLVTSEMVAADGTRVMFL